MNNLTPHNFGRHGEVILKPVQEIPQDAQLVEENKSVIVGHSESGHHHVLTIPRGTGKIKMYEKDGKTYLEFPELANLEHQKTIEKHETQVFTPGKYERVIRHSYSYGEKIMRRVVD